MNLNILFHFQENIKQNNYLPDWLNDETMKNAKNDTISMNEEQFWLDLIEKYLRPLDRNEAEEVRIYSFLNVFIYNLILICRKK